MPHNQPTQQDVEQTFTKAIPGDRNFDLAAYDKYLQDVIAMNWQPGAVSRFLVHVVSCWFEFTGSSASMSWMAAQIPH